MSNNYGALLNPAVVTSSSDLFVMANLAGRTLWHRLFDRAPTFEAHLGNASTRRMMAFLEESDERNTDFDWTLSIRFVQWYLQDASGKGEKIDSDLERELVFESLCSAAASWAPSKSDLKHTHLVITCTHTAASVGVERTDSLKRAANIFKLQIPGEMDSGSRFQYALSTRENPWSINHWNTI